MPGNDLDVAVAADESADAREEDDDEDDEPSCSSL
eukprot:CAMPEP_0113510272 /NCGR_PEP_ID=MMETSP0014_2-20120614/38040_1 /TAXON_ID=2857 /ORGANISM="Nitzschia sp." /LENGTH=34 /DNA_ID=CAMNT_0000406197 /DNA_START=202 /DNA_END=306 /DNA_ORIENTATION=+ /assembly_acc=CAM_ASM_000159